MIQIGKGGPKYKLCLFKIESNNVRGVPEVCRLVEDEQTVTLEGGERFMTAYLPVEMLEGDL